jgi:hypothetical protein
MTKWAIAALCCAQHSLLWGTTIKVTSVDSTRSMQIEVKANGTVKTVTAGVLITLVDGASLIDAICANLFKGITVNQLYSAQTIDATAYDADGAKAAWVMKTFLPIVNSASGVSRQIQAAALQLAVWDLIHDSGNGFAAGLVRSTGNTNASVLALAETWRLDALDEAAQAKVFIPVPGTTAFQQLMYDPTCANQAACTPAPVPEPASYAMIAIGLAGVLFGRHRFRRAS